MFSGSEPTSVSSRFASSPDSGRRNARPANRRAKSFAASVLSRSRRLLVQNRQPADDLIGRFDRRLDDRFVPLTRNRGSAQVTLALIVGGERRRQCEGPRRDGRFQMSGVQHRPDAVRRFPFEFDRRGPVFVFEELKPQRYGPASEQVDPLGNFTESPELTQASINACSPATELSSRSRSRTSGESVFTYSRAPFSVVTRKSW